jgi:hypothetical protein
MGNSEVAELRSTTSPPYVRYAGSSRSAYLMGHSAEEADAKAVNEVVFDEL